MKTSFYSPDELLKMGFKKIGVNCLISKNASFYGIEKISLADFVRVDDFCILSGEITIGSYVHISAYCALYGAEGIVIGNFSGLSPRCTLYSSVDDFSGAYLINPMVPEEYTNVSGGKIILKDYVQLGANTITMPNITIDEGVICGAFTFVNRDLISWNMYIGIPVVFHKTRKKDLLQYASKVMEMNEQQ